MSEVQNTGQFSKVIVTTAGKEMIAKSQNGQTLTFTRVALGDGLIENEDDPVNFTAIKNERLSAPIAKYTDRGNGQFELQFRVSNQEVETGFWHREIGVMAKIDEGEEQLYAYTTAGNQASFLYDKTTPIEERIVNVAFIIGNAQNVQVVVNSSIIYVTLEDMEEALDTHNSSADSHAEAFAQHDNNEDSHAPAFKKHNDDKNSHEPAFTKHDNNEDAHQAAIQKHNTDENAHENLIDMLMEVIENSGINILKRNKAYNVGDIAYSTKITSTTHLASKLYLECIEAGTSGASEPTLTNVNINDEITDGIAKFKVYDVGLQSRPVGNIYQSTNATSPAELFGGTWEEMPAGRVLLAQGQSDWGTNYVAGSTGGEHQHQLTVGELPSHNHSGSTNNVNISGGFNLDGTEQGSGTGAWGSFSLGGTFTPGKGHGSSGGGSNAGRTINFNNSHSHNITINSTGSGQKHNNMQPYISVYMWKRIA